MNAPGSGGEENTKRVQQGNAHVSATTTAAPWLSDNGLWSSSSSSLSRVTPTRVTQPASSMGEVRNHLRCINTAASLPPLSPSIRSTLPPDALLINVQNSVTTRHVETSPLVRSGSADKKTHHTQTVLMSPSGSSSSSSSYSAGSHSQPRVGGSSSPQPQVPSQEICAVLEGHDDDSGGLAIPTATQREKSDASAPKEVMSLSPYSSEEGERHGLQISDGGPGASVEDGLVPPSRLHEFQSDALGWRASSSLPPQSRSLSAATDALGSVKGLAKAKEGMGTAVPKQQQAVRMPLDVDRGEMTGFSASSASHATRDVLARKDKCGGATVAAASTGSRDQEQHTRQQGHWVSCAHSDPPTRYRDTPGYYCTYCSYTVCATCFALIDRCNSAAAESRVDMRKGACNKESENANNDDLFHEDRCEKEVASAPCTQLKERTQQRSSHSAVPAASASDGFACSTTDSTSMPPSPPLEEEMDWLDDLITSSPTAVRNAEVGSAATAIATSVISPRIPLAKHANRGSGSDGHAQTFREAASHAMAMGDPTATIPCHLCRRGHLMREEALLHEWCCEGPLPQARRHGGANLIYNTENLQRYHFMRGQRERRLSSTQPLVARLHAVVPPKLQAEMENRPVKGAPLCCAHDVSSSSHRIVSHFCSSGAAASVGGPLQPPHLTQRPLRLREDVANAPVRRDPVPSMTSAGKPSASTRHGRHIMETGGEPDTRALATAPVPSPLPVSRPTALDSCEEGGHFIFSVWNPRLEIPLVWCAVNREAREEASAYCHEAGVNDGPQGRNILSPSASITPLFTWYCPPSLPGLPARQYSVTIPYGLYAFGNTHAVALYLASDIFRKSSTQLTTTTASELSAGHRTVYDTISYANEEQPLQLAAVKLTPAASLHALLVVNVLHHVATTPHPLFFRPSKSGLAGCQVQRKRSRSVEDVRRKRRQEEEAPTQTPTDGAGCSAVSADAPARSEPPRPRETLETPSNPDLRWPYGLASPELTLCVDHLLQGRSVAVYGIASKYFFLHHVIQSAELSQFHVVTVDASLGRASSSRSTTRNTATSSGSTAAENALVRGCGQQSENDVRQSNSTAKTASSILRQLSDVGNLLAKRTNGAPPSSKESSTMQDARGQVSGGLPKGLKPQERHQEQPTHPIPLSGLERAAFQGESARSPAVARDSTNAMLRSPNAAANATKQDVVDVDDDSNSSLAVLAWRYDDSTSGRNHREDCDADMLGSSVGEERMTKQLSWHADTVATPVRGTVQEPLASPSAENGGGGSAATLPSIESCRTPLRLGLLASPSSLTEASVSRQESNLGHDARRAEQASPATQPSMSPLPAFFDMLHRTVAGSQQSTSEQEYHHNKREADTGKTEPPSPDSRQPRPMTYVELPEYAGHLNSLFLPPLAATAVADVKMSQQDSGQEGTVEEVVPKSVDAVATVATKEVQWCAPVVQFASEAVRQLVVRSVRRSQPSRRCVRWVSLPSVTAMTQMTSPKAAAVPSPRQSTKELYPSASASPLLLTHAHALRPGWAPPLLLALHNVDLLDTEEISLLLRLCAGFAYPSPHLQLLLSFDDPWWPLTPAAAALARIGVCVVQLRSLLLPRVHEMQNVKSIHLLRDTEVAAAGGHIAGATGARGANRATLAATHSGAGTSSSGGSHLLLDTMRRVLSSLPTAFNRLLRILIDVQLEVGESRRIPIFMAKEQFEQHGIMISQGRLKSFLQELTSNRIAVYDMAEYALTVLQPQRLRNVLDEVTAQRDAAGAAT